MEIVVVGWGKIIEYASKAGLCERRVDSINIISIVLTTSLCYDVFVNFSMKPCFGYNYDSPLAGALLTPTRDSPFLS